MLPKKAAPRPPSLEATLAAFAEQLSKFLTNLQLHLGQPITPPSLPTQPSVHQPSPPPQCPSGIRFKPLAPLAFSQELAAGFAPKMPLPLSPVPQELLLHEPIVFAPSPPLPESPLPQVFLLHDPVGLVPSQDEPPPEPPDIDDDFSAPSTDLAPDPIAIPFPATTPPLLPVPSFRWSTTKAALACNHTPYFSSIPFNAPESWCHKPWSIGRTSTRCSNCLPATPNYPRALRTRPLLMGRVLIRSHDSP